MEGQKKQITVCEEGGYFLSKRFTKTCYDDAVLLALAKFPLMSLKNQLTFNMTNSIVKNDELTITQILQIILETNALDISQVLEPQLQEPKKQPSELVQKENVNLMKQYYDYIHNNIIKIHDNKFTRLGVYIDQLISKLNLNTISYQSYVNQDNEIIPENIPENATIVAYYDARVEFDKYGTKPNDDIAFGYESILGKFGPKTKPWPIEKWASEQRLRQAQIKKYNIFSIISISDNRKQFSVYVLNPCNENKWTRWDVTNNTTETTCKEGKNTDQTTDEILEHVADKGLVYLYTTQNNIDTAKKWSLEPLSSSQSTTQQPKKKPEQQPEQSSEKKPEKTTEQEQPTTPTTPSTSLIQSTQSTATSTESTTTSTPTLTTSTESTPSTPSTPTLTTSTSSTQISIPEKYVPMDTKTRIEEIKQNMPNDHHLNSSVASLRFVELSLQCVKPTTNQRSIDYGTFKSMGNLCILQGDESLKEAPIGTLVVLSISGQSNRKTKTTIYMKIDRETYITLNNYYGFDPAGESTLYVDGIGKFTVKGIIFKQ